ncbi:MAG: efflux RND transporter periplasmic adaptor subunit [Candidatus Scalinduaceae bacterium]
MKTVIFVRIFLICLILASAAFLAVKLNILWKGKPVGYSKGLRKEGDLKHNTKTKSSYRSDKKSEKIVEGFSKTRKKDYEAVPIEITRVKRKDLEIFLVNNCTLEPEKQVDVVAKTTGIVKNVFVEEGDHVESGELLARLDDEELLLALKDARIKKENAERVYEWSLKNFEENIISRDEVEDKRFQFEVASVELEKKQLEYKYASIKSPISGVITDRNIEEGYNVKSDQVVFKIVDFVPILAKIYVPEKDLNKIKEGQKARIISEFASEVEFMGNVKMISPVVDPESGTVKVTIELDDLIGGVLKPGMFVSVYTIVGEHQDAIVIPKKALILEAETDEVFVVRDFIVMDVDSAGVKGLAIGDGVVCERKKNPQRSLLNGGDSTVSGKVVDISRSHDNRLPFIITVELDSVIDEKISNVFDRVSFYDNRETQVLQIEDILFSKETKAFKTKITLGFREGSIVEVLAGLKEGDRVITVGQNDIGHGAKVIIVNEEKEIVELEET